MEIISLFNNFCNTFNKTFENNATPLNLESKIRDVGDSFTIKLYENMLNNLDLKFKNSEERKKKYYVKETRKRTLITSVGVITINSTSYVDKETKEYFIPLRDILNLQPYQRLTEEAEYQLIKYAKEKNMSQAAKHALRNTIVSRSTVSKKIQALNGSIKEDIVKSTNQPLILYIEMDEIHANLQHGGNRICPCAIVHEGYEEDFAKRKKLKNVRYFASSELTYEELWEVIFDYVDKKYDIDKFKKIFVSGDGAPGIKKYTNCFPDALFVLDSFHYFKKHLQYIFKGNNDLINTADEYIRNDLIDEFKVLIDVQIEKFPEQEDKMKDHMNYIINNISGIKNQKDEDYKVHCSMEGHVNQAFARYITSSPYGFSKKGLENKLKLLVCHANKKEFTMENYYNLKYGNNEYEEINNKINEICNIKYDRKSIFNYTKEYKIDTSLPKLNNATDNNRLKELTSPRKEVYII